MDAVNIQTKFGLGEIVTTHQRRKGNQIIHDQIGGGLRQLRRAILRLRRGLAESAH